MTERRPLLVVDGDNMAHRAFHALPKTITGKEHRPINAIVGWTSMLLAVWDAEQPRGVFVAWDTLGIPTYRHELWPTYQAGRTFDAALVDQLEELPALGAACGFGVGKNAGYEADDLMAAAVLHETRQGGTCLVLTTDRDMYQLVSESVTILAPTKGIRELARIGTAEVVQRLGVSPDQVPDFKALAGDPSDNVPGAPGIGPKKAAGLLKQFAGLEGMRDAGIFSGSAADQLLCFREIVRLRPDVAVTLPSAGEPCWEGGAQALDALGAATLAERLRQRAILAS